MEDVGKFVAKKSLEDPWFLDVDKHFAFDVLAVSEGRNLPRRSGRSGEIGENVGEVVANESLEDPWVLDVVKHFGLDVLDGPFWVTSGKPAGAEIRQVDLGRVPLHAKAAPPPDDFSYESLGGNDDFPPKSYFSLGETDDFPQRAIFPLVKLQLSRIFHDSSRFFRTFLGDFSPQKLPSRRL